MLSMRRLIRTLGAYAIGAALGAAAPWIYYYSGIKHRHDLWRELFAPPGPVATILWAAIGVGIVLALRGDGPIRRR